MTKSTNNHVYCTKCPFCPAEYETDQRAEEFVEEFVCDCGHRMKFTVPADPNAKPTVIIPTNDQIIALNDPDARLDTGMTVREAIARTAQWWEKSGRKLMTAELSRQSEAVGGSNNGAGAAFASKDVASPNFLPSGLIHGLPWEALSKSEKMRLIKRFHHFAIRKPDLTNDDPEQVHKFQDRGSIK